MSVRLSAKDREMLSGQHGDAARFAMVIVVQMANVCAATELMNVTQAHIDGCALVTDSSLEFAETLAAHGGRVSIPTTTNMIPLDLQNWRRLGVPEEFAAKAMRISEAYTNMGCIPTWTCAPYRGYLTPRFGQQIAWAESNAIVYANSVLGARTNRYGDFMDICAAITGRVPKAGLHLKENRKGQILLRLLNIDPSLFADNSIYVALGRLMGNLVQDRIPVIEGLPDTATRDQLKALGAAAASSGAVALSHAIGVTLEANTLEEAFQADTPRQIIDVRFSDLKEACADLSSAEEGEKLDVVVLGCPHFSFTEFQQLAQAIKDNAGSHCTNTRMVVLTSQASYALLQRSDLLDYFSDFGAEIILDTCMFDSPIIDPEARVLMTNSGKFAYYAPGNLNVRVAFGDLCDCVRSAITGVVCREESLWETS